LQRKREYPFWLAASSAPRAISVNKGFETSGSINAKVFEFDAWIFFAKLLETNPSSSIACWTLTSVAGATISGRFRTLETVPIDTRALRATWRTLTVMREFLALRGD
jgi:hypothetical protein